MELEKEQIRLLLNLDYKVGVNASEAQRQICKAYGDRTVSIRTAQEWFEIFREEGDRSTDNPSVTCRMLVDDFDCSPQTICTILHEAGKRWLKSKWVPHELTEAQKQKRLDVCTRLFEHYSQDELRLGARTFWTTCYFKFSPPFNKLLFNKNDFKRFIKYRMR